MSPAPAISSLFLSKSQSSLTHSIGQSTCLGSELIDLTSSSDSLIFSESTPASVVSSRSPRSDFPTLCCDHGHAIIDLRCTNDVMQFKMTELQKQLSELKKNTLHMWWPIKVLIKHWEIYLISCCCRLTASNQVLKCLISMIQHQTIHLVTF